MSDERRKIRNAKNLRALAWQAFTGFQIIFLAASCGGSSKKTVKNSIDKYKKRVCLSAEGKGRFRSKRNKYLFSFDSALKGSHSWVLGLHIPIHGEEVIEFDWKNAPTVKGSFYHRLLYSFKNNKHKQGLLNKFLRGSIEVIEVLSSEKVKRSDQLLIDSKVLQGHVLITKEISERYAIQWDFSRLDNYYKRLNLQLIDKNRKGKVRSELEMDLFLTSCHK